MNLGLSIIMGPELRNLVERQLIEDLKYYNYNDTDLYFDWSQSCPEGRTAKYLGGSIENFSGISLINSANKLIAEGWMEFIHDENHFKVYWDLLIFKNHHMIEKTEFGIPEHIKDFIVINNIDTGDKKL